MKTADEWMNELPLHPISDEAKEAASNEISDAYQRATLKPSNLVGYHAQLAIDKATEKLETANEQLQQSCDELSNGLTASYHAREKLEKQMMGLREALQKLNECQGETVPVSNDEFMRVSWIREIVVPILSSTPDFSKQFVKREALEKAQDAMNTCVTGNGGQCHNATMIKEALTLAKAELEGEK